MNAKLSPRAAAARGRPATVAELEAALRAGGSPEPPADLHEAILRALDRAGPVPVRARRARWLTLAAAALAVCMFAAWAPFGRVLRVRRLARTVQTGNARLAEWLGQKIEHGHAALYREGEIFLADMREGTRFLVDRLPFGAGVLAAVHPDARLLPGGAP